MSSMGLLHSIYMVNSVVLLFSFLNSVMNAHLPRSDGSCPLLIIEEVCLFKEIIAVLPGL